MKDQSAEGSSSARISSRIKDIIVRGTADDQPHRRKRIKEGYSSARISSRINDIIFGGAAVSTTSSSEELKDRRHRRKSMEEETSSARINSRINHIIVRGSRRTSTSSDGEWEVVRFDTRTYRTSSTIRFGSYIFSLWTDWKRKGT